MQRNEETFILSSLNYQLGIGPRSILPKAVWKLGYTERKRSYLERSVVIDQPLIVSLSQ